MSDIRTELQRIKLENHELENELRGTHCSVFLTVHLADNDLANANVEQKARLLENKVAENAETIEQLRRERSLLVSDHKKLQKQFTEVSEVRSQGPEDLLHS